MGNNKHGFDLENDLLTHINENVIYDKFNQNIMKFCDFVFPFKLKGKQIRAIAGQKGSKVDMVLVCNQIKRNISIKTGFGNSIHQENILLFVDFLRELKIEEKIITSILKYHYGEIFNNQNIKMRLNSKELKKIMINELREINVTLNNNNILTELVKRFLLQGKDKNMPIIDFIYYGDLENGIWASSKELTTYVQNKKHFNNGIFIGAFNYQTWNRNLSLNPDYEYKRETMQIKWPTLKEDLENIRNGL
jgi:hypothetical protein